MLASPSLAPSTLPAPGPLWYGAPAALPPSSSGHPPLAGVQPSAPSRHQGDSAVTWKRGPHSSEALHPAHPGDSAALQRCPQARTDHNTAPTHVNGRWQAASLSLVTALHPRAVTCGQIQGPCSCDSLDQGETRSSADAREAL